MKANPVKTITKCVKRALIRDFSVPAGQSAPLHVNCGCGHSVAIEGLSNTCENCFTTYSDSGWIIEEARCPKHDRVQPCSACIHEDWENRKAELRKRYPADYDENGGAR